MTGKRFPGNYEPLSIDDPRRPIKVLGTVNAQVPSDSEPFLNHAVDRVKFPNGNVGWYHRVRIPHGVMLAHIDDNEELALVKNLGMY